jgi:hypothetical protein
MDREKGEERKKEKIELIISIFYCPVFAVGVGWVLLPAACACA